MEYDKTGFAIAPDGTRLFYGVRGSGVADAVLNDGIGCDGFAWKYLQPRLAERFRVVHWHYRGHGRSGPPRNPARRTIQELAEDQQAVLDALGSASSVQFGHSMGTQVAIEAYRRRPDRVRGLVLLCGSYGRVTRTFHGSDFLYNVLPQLIRWVDRNRGLVRGLWGRVPTWLAFKIAKLSREVDALTISEEDFRNYAQHFASMDPDVFLGMLREAGEHSAEDLLERIDTPTLVLAAERDTFTPFELARKMAEAIPDAVFHLIPGASHAAPVERPSQIYEWITTFLDERLPPADAPHAARSIAAELLRTYVERHNDGVRARDFSKLIELFAEHAELRFENGAVGPFTGKEQIVAAFRNRGPSDELVLLDDDGTYAWRARPAQNAGRIRIGIEAGKIVSVLVQVV